MLTQPRKLRDAELARRLCLISGLAEDYTKQVVSEVFSPPRVTQALKSGKCGWLQAGSSFDLVVDADSGRSWNFLDADDRRRCWRRLKAEDPWMIIGSPPCTPFSALQALNKRKGTAAGRERKLTEGKIWEVFWGGV